MQLVLDRLKLSDLAERQIGELFGGQQQRTLLAPATVQGASLCLPDDHLSAVAEATRHGFDEVLCEETRSGTCSLAATHGSGRLSVSFERAVSLRHGCITVAFCHGSSSRLSASRRRRLDGKQGNPMQVILKGCQMVAGGR